MVLVYPNQRIVTVHKAPANKDNVYGVLNKEAAFSAMQNLTHNEMKVFMYLSLNQTEYSMALSTADAAAKVGSTEDGMRKAVQGLIKKGYLVQDHGREYDFYEDPELALPKKQKQNNKNFTVSSMENSDSTTAKSSVCKAQIEGEIIKREK